MSEIIYFPPLLPILFVRRASEFMKDPFQLRLTGDKKKLVKGRKGRAMRRYLKQFARFYKHMMDKSNIKEVMAKSYSDMMLYGESVTNMDDIKFTPPPIP